MNELNRQFKDRIAEKDAENEAKTIFIETITKKWGEWAFWKRMQDLKVLVLSLKNSKTALVLRETEHEMKAETQR